MSTPSLAHSSGNHQQISFEPIRLGTSTHADLIRWGITVAVIATMLLSIPSPGISVVLGSLVAAVTSIGGAWVVAYGYILKCRADREHLRLGLEREKLQLAKDFPEEYLHRLDLLTKENEQLREDNRKIKAVANGNSVAIETITTAMSEVPTIEAKIIH